LFIILETGFQQRLLYQTSPLYALLFGSRCRHQTSSKNLCSKAFVKQRLNGFLQNHLLKGLDDLAAKWDCQYSLHRLVLKNQNIFFDISLDFKRLNLRSHFLICEFSKIFLAEI
jgi:hypothetical protein